MSQPHKIVLVGFSSFEKVTFESFFRLAARRPPGYVLVEDASQAHLAVVNADDSAVLRQCIATKPAAQVLLIGSQDGGTGWMLQRRPLNLMKVLATVESLLATPTASMATVPAELSPMRASSAAPAASSAAYAARPAAAPSPAAPAFSGFARTPAPVSTPAAAPAPSFSTTASSAAQARPSLASGGPDSTMRRSVRTGAGSLPSYESARAAEGLTGLSPAKTVPPDSAMDVDHILVVDDSDIALKFMRNRLSRFGFHADLVNSGEEALGKMNTKPYKFVFLDVMMEGLDGYQTCRAIKQRKYSDGKPPVVVMLTSRGGTIDKIRGTLAGCDAYLTKPLNERDLIAVLAKHDRNVARGFQETNFGGNSGSGFARSAQ
jgi:two-component system, cell cycle response regulator